MGFRGFLNWTIGLVRNNKSLDEYDEDLLMFGPGNEDTLSPYSHVNGTEKYKIPKCPNEEVLKFVEYPSKPRGITVFNEQSILSLHVDKLKKISMRIAIDDNDISDDAFTFTNLITKPLIEFIRWVHLLPASENHHHNGIGGLFSHSLDVGLLSLIQAYDSELAPIGYQDEEVQRKKAYLYAAFICGLVHDAGKIYDVDVVSSDTLKTTTWNPTAQSLLDWCNSENVKSYEIHWRVRRVNQHNIWSSVFLERILNPTCLRFLGVVSRERIYDRMLSSLNSYINANDFLSRCVRRADYYSTGTDLNVIRDPIIGLRSTDAATRAMSAVKHKFKDLGINDYQSKSMHIIIVNGEVYFNEQTFLDFILKEFQEIKFNFPQDEVGRLALTEALIRRGYIEPYSDSRIVHYFMPGKYTESDVQQMFATGIAEVPFYNLLKVKWIGLIFDSYFIPDSVPGLFSVNENRDLILIDEFRNVSEFLRPMPGRKEVITVNDSFETAAQKKADSVKVISPETVNVKSNSAESNTDSSVAVDQPREDNEEKTPYPDITDDSQVKPDEALVQQTSVIDALTELFTTTKIPDSAICLVDGVPYAVVSEIILLAPGTEESHLAESGLFQQTFREGSFDGQWVIRDENNIAIIALGDSFAGYQMSGRNLRTTKLKSLLDSGLYQTVELSERHEEVEEPNLTDHKPLPLPPENYPGMDDDSPPAYLSEGPDLWDESLNLESCLDDVYMELEQSVLSELHQAPHDDSVDAINTSIEQVVNSYSETAIEDSDVHQGEDVIVHEQVAPDKTLTPPALPLTVEPVVTAPIKKLQVQPQLTSIFSRISESNSLFSFTEPGKGSSEPVTNSGQLQQDKDPDQTEQAASADTQKNSGKTLNSNDKPITQNVTSTVQVEITSDSTPLEVDYENLAGEFMALVTSKKQTKQSVVSYHSLIVFGGALYVGTRRIDNKALIELLNKFPTCKVKVKKTVTMICSKINIAELIVAGERSNLHFEHIISEIEKSQEL